VVNGGSGRRRLGLAFVISGMVTTLGFLAVRVLEQRELGADALGQLQVPWAIRMTYLGFVLGVSVRPDCYPFQRQGSRSLVIL
jgi:hypothetical protein